MPAVPAVPVAQSAAQSAVPVAQAVSVGMPSLAPVDTVVAAPQPAAPLEASVAMGQKIPDSVAEGMRRWQRKTLPAAVAPTTAAAPTHTDGANSNQTAKSRWQSAQRAATSTLQSAQRAGTAATSALQSAQRTATSNLQKAAVAAAKDKQPRLVKVMIILAVIFFILAFYILDEECDSNTESYYRACWITLTVFLIGVVVLQLIISLLTSRTKMSI